MEDCSMVTYMLLMKLTEQGIKNIKDAPDRYNAAFKALEKAGGKVIGFWIAIGEYDYVAIGESVSDEAALAFAVGLSALGNLRVESVKLFSKQQFEGALKMLSK
jgi:uncharacterized protein with GYD domain